MIKVEVYIKLAEESKEPFNEDVFFKDLSDLKDSEGIYKIDYCYVSSMVDLDD